MTARLVFSVPDRQKGREVVQQLKDTGVGESCISVIGNDAEQLSELPDPGEFENDVVPASQRGALFGGATGLLAGLGAVVVAPGLAIGGAALALALATAGGATFGVLASSIVGASVPNSQLREYEDAIAEGALLMVVELKDDQRSAVMESLHARFPELELHGEVDDIPPVV